MDTPPCNYGYKHDFTDGSLSRWCLNCWLVVPYDKKMKPVKVPPRRASSDQLLNDPRPGGKRRQSNGDPVKRSAGQASPTQRALVLERDGYQCRYCGRAVSVDVPQDHPARLTFDHVIPRSQGGKGNAANLVISCRRCNDAKKDTSYDDFMMWLKKNESA